MGSGFSREPLTLRKRQEPEDISPCCSTKTEMTNRELGWKYPSPPKGRPCLLGSHTPDNGRIEPSSDLIYSRDWCVSGSEWCVNIRNSDTGWLKPPVLGIFSFQEILMWGRLEPHQQANKKGRQSRRGGNRTVRTDLKAVQELSFPHRQLGILLQSQFLRWQNGDDNI